MSNSEQIVKVIYKHNKFWCNRKVVTVPITIKALLIGKGDKSTALIRRKLIT